MAEREDLYTLSEVVKGLQECDFGNSDDEFDGFLGSDTVEPPKRGHFGDSTFVLSSEVVLFSEVV